MHNQTVRCSESSKFDQFKYYATIFSTATLSTVGYSVFENRCYGVISNVLSHTVHIPTSRKTPRDCVDGGHGSMDLVSCLRVETHSCGHEDNKIVVVVRFWCKDKQEHYTLAKLR